VIVAVGLIAALYFGYRWWQRGHSPNVAAAHAAGGTDKAAVRVEYVHPLKGGIARTTTQPGVIHAYDYVRLHAKVSGFLRAQVVDIGDTVQHGQQVAVIFAPELPQRAATAAAAVERARAEVTQARAMVDVADAEVVASRADVREAEARVGQFTSTRKYRQKEFVRYTELAVSKAVDERAADEMQDNFESAKAGENVALAAVDTAKGKLAKALAQVQKAHADVKAAEAAEREAEAEQGAAQIFVDYTRLIAPFDGVVTERNYHDGDFIRAADTGAETPPILSISRTDLMRVVIYVPDREVPYVDRDDAAVVRIDALAGEEFKGKVTRFSNLEMAANRSMRVEVDLPNPNGLLREGMYGNVTIELDPASDLLRIPSPALIKDTEHGLGTVYLVKDGHAREQPVRIGRDNGLVVEILSGLTERDQVIVSYGGSIEDGEEIEAFPAEGRRSGSK